MPISTGDLLMGLGAAVGGTGPQYLQGLQQREQQMTQQKRAELQARQQAMYQDAYTALNLLKTGDLDGIIALGKDRLEMLKTFPDANPSDTQRVVQNAILAKQGDSSAVANLAKDLVSATSRGLSMGMIKLPEPEKLQEIPQGGSLYSQRQGKIIAQGTPKPVDKFTVLTPEQVKTLGLEPGSYKQDITTGEVSKIGGATTTINLGEQTPELGKEVDKQFANALDAAGTSAAARPQLEMLKQLAPITTTGAIPAAISKMFPTFNDANAAFIGIANQVLPSLRVPGSGSQSDKDIDVLLNSIGNLASSAATKQLTIQSLIEKDNINQQLADIAQEYASGNINRAEALKRRREINSRGIIPVELKSLLSSVANIPKSARDNGVTLEEWNKMTPEQKKVWK